MQMTQHAISSNRKAHQGKNYNLKMSHTSHDSLESADRNSYVEEIVKNSTSLFLLNIAATNFVAQLAL